jgi:hypothetical protein
MTESDYSIRPLQNLPNVAGLKAVKDNEDKKRRQNSQEQSLPQEKQELAQDEHEKFEEQILENNIEDGNRAGIDYCA